MATDWAKVIAMKTVKFLLWGIFILLLVTVLVGLFTNKPIEIWVLKFNTKEYVARIDTVKITIHDTIRLTASNNPNSLKKNSPIINAKNVNSGINSGIVGDNGVINIDQPVLTNAHKKSILDSVERLQKEHNTNKVQLHLSTGSNAGQFASDLNVFLTSKGYIVTNVTMANIFTGILYDVLPCYDGSPKCIRVYIGNLK